LTQNITVEEITAALLAIPAFVPVAVCTGYLAGWCSNVLDFRQRSLVERFFWSIPLSFSVSPVFAVLIAKFSSLAVAEFLVLASVPLCLIVLGREWFRHRRSGKHFNVGLRPLGATALAMALVWVILVIVSLIDIQKNTSLYPSLFSLDHSARIDWTESVLHTGVPPANPLYFFRHPAPLRNYYFWYVLCALVAKFSGLPARAVMTASCAWAGFALAAIVGLCLKHFLHAGARLRKQFIIAMLLLCVTGLDICANIIDVLFLHRPLTMDLEWWSVESIYSWYGSLLWAPHHVAGLVCCLIAFLLAWNAEHRSILNTCATVALIGAALASSFGFSIFVPFGFFLVMLAWGVWQLNFEGRPRPVVYMAAGGALATLLLIPFLLELSHNPGNTGATAGLGAAGSLFTFAVREMIPPDGVLHHEPLRHLVIPHPTAARNIAKLLLLLPSYVIELGFYGLVLLIYLIPLWRDQKPLSPAQRSLLFIALSTFPIISFLRSTILSGNDFGWRAAMILQFPLLLFGSEVIDSWNRESRAGQTLPRTQRSMQAILRITLLIGVISTLSQMLMLRFSFPLLEAGYRAKNSPLAGSFAHNAYISYIGYQRLDRAIPSNSVVQFAPLEPGSLRTSIEVENVDHPIAMLVNSPGCGAGAGGDPSGCPALLADIPPLFQGGTSDHARRACLEHGIQYLVTNVYDPVWKDANSWVWTLKPVVADPEFRALDCRQQAGQP
jgi:hypothetical protein